MVVLDSVITCQRKKYEEDKFQMQEIDTAFDYIPDESNDSVIYTKEPIPISVCVKPVKFCEEDTQETN